ncbi:hypothetical protein EJ04DRAFT_581589 [Polyplosphaeria fusca]|uniref:Uncharacterized protein n=1 Tax=Polyplosphaeria fusca TaxID=682080 RepID=A0A9P4UWR7_9PLEO|nr:hypothetical protein EJ04DRAFT_581589 [Polyplosphaeria fusca]
MPSLTQHFTVRAYLGKQALQLKNIKSGPTRIIIPITDGFVRGKNFSAQITGGGDWPLSNPTTSTLHLNVRLQATTPSGSALYIHYPGTLKLDDLIQKAFSRAPDAQSTLSGQHYWFSSPVMETDDAEWKWVEDVTWVGQGHMVVEGEGEGMRVAVEYEVYMVGN